MKMNVLLHRKVGIATAVKVLNLKDVFKQSEAIVFDQTQCSTSSCCSTHCNYYTICDCMASILCHCHDAHIYKVYSTRGFWDTGGPGGGSAVLFVVRLGAGSNNVTLSSLAPMQQMKTMAAIALIIAPAVAT